MPIMRMIALSVCWSVGTRWLASWFRPVAASTAEKASRTGSPAATSAPNATIRMATVSGSEVSSARCMSLPKRSSSWCAADAWPNSSMIRLGFPACARSTAARIGAIRSLAFSALPLTSNWTSAEWRSRDTSPARGWSIGETMLVTSASPESVCTTLATAAVKVCSPNETVCDWTSTLSRAGILKLPWSWICSARLDSPFANAHDFICFAPTKPPTATARTAKAIQPNAAVFQCDALQRPARPARFVVVSMTASLPGAPLADRDRRQHLLRELDEPCRIAPLVVVPGNDLDLRAVDDGRQARVEDRRVLGLDRVARDERLLAVL